MVPKNPYGLLVCIGNGIEIIDVVVNVKGTRQCQRKSNVKGTRHTPMLMLGDYEDANGSRVKTKKYYPFDTKG